MQDWSHSCRTSQSLCHTTTVSWEATVTARPYRRSFGMHCNTGRWSDLEENEEGTTLLKSSSGFTYTPPWGPQWQRGQIPKAVNKNTHETLSLRGKGGFWMESRNWGSSHKQQSLSAFWEPPSWLGFSPSLCNQLRGKGGVCIRRFSPASHTHNSCFARRRGGAFCSTETKWKKLSNEQGQVKNLFSAFYIYSAGVPPHPAHIGTHLTSEEPRSRLISLSLPG